MIILEESSFYLLHPVFEFYLTAYFAFVIAPEFMNNFLGFKIPDYLERSKNKTIKKLKRYQSKMEALKKRINNDSHLSEFLYSTFMEFNSISQSIEDEIKEINNLTVITFPIDDTKKQIVKKVSSMFAWVFTLMIIFNLFILTMNACKYLKEHESIVSLHILCFNISCSVMILFLLIRPAIGKYGQIIAPPHRFKIINSILKWRFNSKLFFLFVILLFILSFRILPRNEVILNYAEMDIVIVCTLVIGIIPTLLYFIFLRYFSQRPIQEHKKANLRSLKYIFWANYYPCKYKYWMNRKDRNSPNI
jgi:hypothetical protein